MRVASGLRLEPARESLGPSFPPLPARLALVADDGEELDAIPLQDLRKALDDTPSDEAASRDALQARIDAAIDRIDQSGGVDGAHHKQWVLDQVLRALLSPRDYASLIARRRADGYDWDEGIPP